MDRCPYCLGWIYGSDLSPHRCPPEWRVWDEDEWAERENYPDLLAGFVAYGSTAEDAVLWYVEHHFAARDYSVEGNWAVVQDGAAMDTVQWFDVQTTPVPEHHATEIRKKE